MENSDPLRSLIFVSRLACVQYQASICILKLGEKRLGHCQFSNSFTTWVPNEISSDSPRLIAFSYALKTAPAFQIQFNSPVVTFPFRAEGETQTRVEKAAKIKEVDDEVVALKREIQKVFRNIHG